MTFFNLSLFENKKNCFSTVFFKNPRNNLNSTLKQLKYFEKQQ